ncbi:MAG: DUF3450 domain-containing protein [Kiritimatiellae bacterium]|nr:DUF3450 domain-containing protein [Kiritimatiellia bacterium]
MRRWRRWLGVAAVLGMPAAPVPALTAVTNSPPDAEAEGRAAIEKWVETRRLLSRETQEWRVAREILEGRAELLSREVETIEAQIRQTTNEIGELDVKLAESRAQRERLVAATAGLDESIARLERRVVGLLERMPAPLRERVQPLSQRIPAPEAASPPPLAERFQNVIGVLNELQKAAREILVTSEVRTLDGGERIEVTVLYIGLAQAYFVNPAGTVAGVGRPGPKGWTWERDDQLAAAVQAAIAVYRNERPAEYVRLPVVMDD